MHTIHKVITYVEYRAVAGVFQNIDPPPPTLRVCPPPAAKAGGMASYSIISPRSNPIQIN
jgi:hypothetical protein